MNSNMLRMLGLAIALSVSNITKLHAFYACLPAYLCAGIAYPSFIGVFTIVCVCVCVYPDVCYVYHDMCVHCACQLVCQGDVTYGRFLIQVFDHLLGCCTLCTLLPCVPY